MSKLTPCPTCQAFLPANASACPCCARAVPRWVIRAAAILGSSALAMTLSACYGAPCANGGACYELVPPEATARCPDLRQDTDGDGACGYWDCDERDPAIQRCGYGE